MPENYSDFVSELLEAGFSLAGGNPNGIYSIIPFTWEQQPLILDSPIRWHTEDPETDPWEWRMRVLLERTDVAYAKLFFRVGGYITKEWYPCFLAARRRGESFEEAYSRGGIRHAGKRIYEALLRSGPVLLPELKAAAGFGRQESSEFEQALTDLQMGMFVTICGQGRRRNRYGQEYGWNSTRLCTVEQFWGEDILQEAADWDTEEAAASIREQVLKLNPEAKDRAIQKFIFG